MTLPTVDMTAVRRVLLIKLSALGDIIHALPVSAALGEAYPHLEMTWAVEETFAPLIAGNPYISEIVTFPKVNSHKLRSAAFYPDYAARLREVRRRRFDLAVDMQGLTKSAVIAVASRARTRLAYHYLREAATLMVRPVPRRPESVHVVDQYLDIAHFLGATPERVRFPFHIPEEDEAAVDAMLCAEGVGPCDTFVAINPASAMAIKQWGAANYAALMDAVQERMGLPAVMVTADRAVAAEVRESARLPFVDLSGRTTLKQLAAVLRRSAVHVCGDTGSGHLAAALERPVISLIGPTDPERACPYGQRANAISRRQACGSACNWHHCQFAHPRCLGAIHVTDVLARVETLLRAPSVVGG
ncbi:MAG TPA: glycosyltransferase family 9 protein [Chthonomonadaceae bacterium]|nr:glycosyltransferase family 9 protein [Chthonomonadaceae bacterium]